MRKEMSAMSNIALAIENPPGADPDDWFEIIDGVKVMRINLGLQRL